MPFSAANFIASGRDHDDGQLQLHCIQRQLRTRLAWHQAIEYDRIYRHTQPSKGVAHCGAAVRGGRHTPALFKHGDEDIKNVAVVIDHQDVLRQGRPP
jgi:hypothetical protein